MTPAEFLTTLWGERPAGQVLIWTLPDKRSLWLRNGLHDFKVLEVGLQKTYASCDVYTGVSLAPKGVRLSDRQRITNDQSAGIPGLWADIDLRGPAHQKQNLPSTVEEALSALEGVGYEPTITVHSGHGLQCWWLFEHPWRFIDALARDQAQQLCRDWHALVAESFRQKGWTLDATHDLARVLRLPGTVNHKGDPAPVRVISTSDFRWKDIPVLPQTTPTSPQNRHSEALPAEVGELHLNPYLSPPPLKLELLLEMHPKFAMSWEGRRSDFKDGDQSASVYDLSLASIAVQVPPPHQWTDQEIVALLVAHRRQTGQDLKLRLDYYQRTIAKARAESG